MTEVWGKVKGKVTIIKEREKSVKGWIKRGDDAESEGGKKNKTV